MSEITKCKGGCGRAVKVADVDAAGACCYCSKATDKGTKLSDVKTDAKTDAKAR